MTTDRFETGECFGSMKTVKMKNLLWVYDRNTKILLTPGSLRLTKRYEGQLKTKKAKSSHMEKYFL